MRWLEHRIPPPLVMLATGFLMWWTDRWLPGLRMNPVLEWVTLLGWGVAICGFAMDLYCFIGFIQRKTTVNPLKPENASAIIVSGFYRFSRNPMYLGMVLVLVGWVLVLQNPASLVATALFMAFITRFQIIPEERALTARFGEAYLAYTRRVRRWF